MCTLEQVQAILPIFEEVVLESLHREFTVRAGIELSEVPASSLS